MSLRLFGAKVRNHATQIGFQIRVHINVHLARYFDIFLKLGFKPHIIYRWKEQKIYIPKIPYIHGDAFRCEHHAIRKITNEMIANVRELIGYAKQKLSRLSL